MGRELQKKKNKSSLPKVKQKPKSKHLNIRNNPIVAANWSKSLTLAQNYRRLGLTSKLNARAGGNEKFPSSTSLDPRFKTSDPFSITNRNESTLVPGSAKILRDPDTGAILKILYDEEGDERDNGERRKRLHDPLGSDDEAPMNQHDLLRLRKASDNATKESSGIVPELEKRAALGAGRKKPRKLSQRDHEWIGRLVEKYGEDIPGMVRDRKLNPMQQTAGDIGKRVRMWKEAKSLA